MEAWYYRLKNAGVEVERDILLKQITSAETIQAIARAGVSRTKENPLIVYKLSALKLKGSKEDITFANVYDLLDRGNCIWKIQKITTRNSWSKEKALDLVYQNPWLTLNLRVKNRAWKTCLKPMIAGNDTPSIFAI